MQCRDVPYSHPGNVSLVTFGVEHTCQVEIMFTLNVKLTKTLHKLWPMDDHQNYERASHHG